MSKTQIEEQGIHEGDPFAGASLEESDRSSESSSVPIQHDATASEFEITIITPKFPFGQLVATPTVLAQVANSDIHNALRRHSTGDWGDLDEHDRKQNEEALKNGMRLFSVYHSQNRVKFYVITEWDRSVTTVLLPEDY